MSTINSKYNNCLVALMVAIQANIPVLLIGAPGIGKTSTITSIAQALGLLIEVVIASVREPADFAGLPIVHQGSVKLAPPAWAQRLVDEGQGILFLDEISTAAPAVQSALLRVVLDRVVGDVPLPPDVAIVAAANPPEQCSGCWELSAPLSNRFLQIQWYMDAYDWAEGFANGWQMPSPTLVPTNWIEDLPATRMLVATFIKHLPSSLMQFPTEESKASQPWASPRSWDTVTKLLAAARAAQVNEEVLMLLISGCIGQSTAITFLKWLKELDLPTPESLLASPLTAIFPHKRHDKVSVILASVVSYVAKDNTIDNFYHALQLMCSAGRQGMVDTAYPHLKTLLKKAPAGANTNIPEMAVFAPLMNVLSKKAS